MPIVVFGAVASMAGFSVAVGVVGDVTGVAGATGDGEAEAAEAAEGEAAEGEATDEGGGAGVWANEGEALTTRKEAIITGEKILKISGKNGKKEGR